MLNVRLLMVSAIMLAMAATTLRPPQVISLRWVLPTIDWREAKPTLTCPSDVPPDCAMLWGP